MSLTGFHLEIYITVAMVFMSLNVTEINGQSSAGFRGNVVETIRKSRHRIVHVIEAKVNGQSEVSLLSSPM